MLQVFYGTLEMEIYPKTLIQPIHIQKMEFYTVTLTATSSTGLTDEVSEELTVALGFVPIIKNPGFDVPGSNGKIQ